MTSAPPPSLRTVLRAALLDAMKQRERAALTVYRAAIAAIDNAEAVPLAEHDRAGAIEASSVAVGSADTQRRALSEIEVIGVIRAEIDERLSAAELLDEHDTDGARRLRDDAHLLHDLIAGHSPES